MPQFHLGCKLLPLTVAASITLVFVTTSLQVKADMFAWFKKYDVQLSPAVSGKVTFQGKPVSGVKVVRELTYDKEFVDYATTDNNGQFQFAEKTIRSRSPGSAFDTSKRQVLYLDHDNQRYLLWYYSTLNASAAKTLTAKLQQLRCELTQPEKTYELPNQEHPAHPHGVTGICTLD